MNMLISLYLLTYFLCIYALKTAIQIYLSLKLVTMPKVSSKPRVQREI